MRSAIAIVSIALLGNSLAAFPVPKAAAPKVAGTTWNVVTTWNNGQTQNFTLQFLEGGKVVYGTSPTTPGSWELKDGILAWEINNKASTWEAPYADAVCDGKGQNKSGLTATLRLTRIEK